MSKKNLYNVRVETWHEIADKFGVDPKELAAFNNRELSSLLKENEIIEIPIVAGSKIIIDTENDLPKMAAVNKLLFSDKEFRAEFLKNPHQTLLSKGVKVDKELIPSDFPLIKLLDDEKFNKLKESGDIDGMQKHIAKNYPELQDTPVGAVVVPVAAAPAVVAVVVAVPGAVTV